jgi:hypothetical protein
MSPFSFGPRRSSRRRCGDRGREKAAGSRLGRRWRAPWLDGFHPSMERLEERAMLANQPELAITAATAPHVERHESCYTPSPADDDQIFQYSLPLVRALRRNATRSRRCVANAWRKEKTFTLTI